MLDSFEKKSEQMFFGSSILEAGIDFFSALCRNYEKFNLSQNVALGYLLREVFSEIPYLEKKNEVTYDLHKLLEFNTELGFEGFLKGCRSFHEIFCLEFTRFWRSAYGLEEGCAGCGVEGVALYLEEMRAKMKTIARDLPRAIEEIKEEFGFHFEKEENGKIEAETKHFVFYQVFPTDKKVRTDKSKKPVLIIPPFVLGHDILAFLPNEKRSYAHCFANQGIPTYIRVLKDIGTVEAVQTMTPEDDCLDTRFFCQKIKREHGKPVTLNGYCQGGFSVVCDYLSGELDGFADALITCVAPMDGTRSKGLSKFLGSLPPKFNNLNYGAKILPNGQRVADGNLMGWVYELASKGNPLESFCSDFGFCHMACQNGGIKSYKSVLAVQHWLQKTRKDIPFAITKMSFDSYNIPVSEDGTLPVKMFNKKLNFKRIKEKGVKWLICYGVNDDLVEKETALAPLDYIPVEKTGFPKGHIAIATSWSHPESKFPLDGVYDDGSRGPVRFHLDLDKEISNK